jgi:polyphosphate kinase 2
VTTVVADGLPDTDTLRGLFDRLAAELGLRVASKRSGRLTLAGQDGEPVQTWRENYPYCQRLTKQEYEPEMRALQIELLKLQRSLKQDGTRLLMLFEGRDAAGKGGAIRRFTENLNPRGVRVVALDKPASSDQGDNYLGRYLRHLPGPGEIALFDRSWYNRAGVERVMGFCQPEEYSRFLDEVPGFERGLAAGGITLIKLWFSITRAEQLRRFVARLADPVKCWKLSPVDLASLDKWAEYTRAKEAMFARTDIGEAPWTVVLGNDKKRARLEAVRFVLSMFDYPGKLDEVIGRPDPRIVGPVGILAESGTGGGEPVRAAMRIPITRIPAVRVPTPAATQSARPSWLAPAGSP